VENALDGAELFGRGSLEEGSVVEMSQTGTFRFTYRPDDVKNKPKENIQMLFPLFSSFVVVVMFQMVQIHFLYQQTT
jgi:hypothetical protein